MSYPVHDKIFRVDKVLLDVKAHEHRYWGWILNPDGSETRYRASSVLERFIKREEKENKMDTNEYLKKIKVLSRAIYTEVLARAISKDMGEAYCTKEVVDECIDAAVQFESSFANFADNAKRLIQGDKNAEK